MINVRLYDHKLNDKYTIEQHGPEGHYVIYKGRGGTEFPHGFNLCTLSDFDMNGKETRELIEKALNAYNGK